MSASATPTKVVLNNISNEDLLSLSSTELINELLNEREKYRLLELEIKNIKDINAKNFLESEIEEENITNKLIRKISSMKIEKEKIILESEQDEEYITNKLLNHIDLVEHDKDRLEKELHLLNETRAFISPLTQSNSILNLQPSIITSLDIIFDNLNECANEESKPLIVQGKSYLNELRKINNGSSSAPRSLRSSPLPNGHFRESSYEIARDKDQPSHGFLKPAVKKDDN